MPGSLHFCVTLSVYACTMSQTSSIDRRNNPSEEHRMAKRSMAGTALCSECGDRAVHERGLGSPLVIRHTETCSEHPRNRAAKKAACDHAEVRAWSDGDTDNAWAYCTYCEMDLSATWFTSDDRHDYVFVPRTRGRTQTFQRKGVRT